MISKVGMDSNQRVFALVVVLGLTVYSGCGRGAPASVVAGSENSVAAGEAALKTGDFQAANEAFSRAIQRGGLNPDLTEQAMFGRVKAEIGSGKLVEAKVDLDDLAKNATRLDDVWVLRGELALKEGDKAAAKNAFAEAKKLNRAVVIPADAR